MTNHIYRLNIENGGTTPAGWVGKYFTEALSDTGLSGTSVAYSSSPSAFSSGRVTGWDESTGGPIGNFPQEVLGRGARLDSPETLTITFSGFTPGQIGTFSTVMLYDPASATRGGKFTMQGVTKFNGGTDAVEQTFNFVADSNGEVSGQWIADADTGLRCGPTGFIVEWDDTNIQSSLSITAADNITSEGDTATFTLSGNSVAPTGATLNGTSVGTLTDQGSGVYSYTAPLIADDATADLVVSVDSTTVATVISYANSYPYVFNDHGIPEENSVFDPSDQFGTAGDVEIKVVTDFDSGVVVFDWQVISDNQQWRTDVNDLASVTTVSSGSSTATLGYFVPESGATGTFGVSVTVSESGVDVWPFPEDVPSIPVTWDWGSRHPMTQARVRMFKGNS